MNVTRGVLFLVWGAKSDSALQRAIVSVEKVHPELKDHIEVVRLQSDDPVQGLLLKSRMLELSPFTETLFLDADTVVLGRMDRAFDQASDHGLACCICECPWARRYQAADFARDAVEFNTGILAFDRAQPWVGSVFAQWKHFSATQDSSIVWVTDQEKGTLGKMAANDQAGFAMAIEQSGRYPAVLPMNYNLRPAWQRSWFGPVKVWHSYDPVPQSVINAAAYYERPDSIIQYHQL